jgi:dCMP deaminase
MPINALNSLKEADTKRWDKYFHDICITVASKSPCLSRKIGAILVRDKSIISTGYNGPPRGIPHCGHERWLVDEALKDAAKHLDLRTKFRNTCPRQVLGYKSGTHMELCPAQHAEENAVSNAARLGVSVIGSTLYMGSVIPCKNCYGTLINAGIVEIVVEKVEVYDKFTQFLIDNSDIKLREFNL